MIKSIFKAPVAAALALLARGILHTYHPLVVMVTGSVGKTSTKDAVAAALSTKYHLRASEKSYNSEFGVPLTIIGAKNPWNDAGAWLKVFGEALALIFLPSHYPHLLVLEVGADRPGDLRKILSIATPNAVVVTRLPEVPVHVEAYASPAAVREEEFAPAYALAPHAPLIISADDPFAAHLASRLDVHVTTYGFAADADVHLDDAEVFEEDGRGVGMRARTHVGKIEHEIYVRGALGRQQLYAPAAALACALALNLTQKEALKGLEGYVPPPGRGRLLAGVNGSVLIDDTYNSSPSAVEEVLGAFALIKAKRRIAVLGDMLELGRYSSEEHARVGTQAAGNADVIVGVGPRAASITEAARRAGKSDREALHFTTSEAAAHLREIVRPGDAVLIKGSQSIRMERITKALLADPRDVASLVRQDTEWLKKA